MNNGFYKLNSVVLGFDIRNDINKIRFNHYIMRRENVQRLQGTLPRGQFYMTVRRAATDLQLSISTISRLVREFLDLGIIRLVSKGVKGKNHSIYSYISIEFSGSLFEDSKCIELDCVGNRDSVGNDMEFDCVDNRDSVDSNIEFDCIDNRDSVGNDIELDCVGNIDSVDSDIELDYVYKGEFVDNSSDVEFGCNSKDNSFDGDMNVELEYRSNEHLSNDNYDVELSYNNFHNKGAIKNKSISNVNTIKKYINESFDVRKSRGENSNSQSESINLNFNDTYNDIYKRTNNGIENNQTKNVTKLSNSKLSNDTGMTNKKNDFNHTHYMQKGTKSVTKKKESLNKFNKKNIQQSIINMLNKKSGKNFKINSPISIKLINERLKEGYVLEDFYKVIEVKVAKWKNTIMEMYIRPETLFSYKFESYVNENISMKSQSNVHQCKEGTSNDSSNYIHSDYTTYDDSMRERKKYENVRYWNPICEI